MESSKTGLHDFNLASRKAEEAAARQSQAVEWLRSIVGPLGISTQPSEREFISCLRNGLILCNAINKIHPGAVTKVVENYSHLQPFTREYQPLRAYQHFENVRNFLVALEELKLPAFEASDLEKDNLESGSVGKVVDCILGLKAYQEWKSTNADNGSYKHAKSPMVLQSATKILPRGSSDSCRRLDMSSARAQQEQSHMETQKLKDLIAKLLVDHMVDTKENIDENLVSRYVGNQDSRKFLKILLSFMGEQQIPPEFKDFLKESSSSLLSMPLEELPFGEDNKCGRSSSRKGNCNQKRLLKMQEKELWDLKALLSNTKKDLKDLKLELQRDLKELGNQVQEMSAAALGYQKVVTENRKLYNMVQDLKGSIRVYCRVRPIFNSETKSVIDYIGEDGSLVISDPSKPHKDARKSFQFNRVFGPASTQDEVFRDTQPLIRSVMDGYNVCIFAYGQTGSGKTYTMSGPSGGSTTDFGINYLALNDLFLISDRRRDMITYEIFVQMVEIYNEQVRDLLVENSSSTKLDIRSSSGYGLSLPDATMQYVKSTTDVLKLMEIGEMNRAVSSTAMNNRSSRSHSVLAVHVRGKDTSGGSLQSCLHLVDLAGSERVDKSEVTGDRLKEAQFINKSLSCLGDVISALAQKNPHIPYRNSKLTLLLQGSLGGQAKTLMFAHLSPEEESFSETMSTLKFAQRVSTVELGAAHSHKESGEVMQLKEQIESLKKALANKEGQNGFNSRTKELKSPSSRPVAAAESPPRARRLSLENCSTTKTERRGKDLSMGNSGLEVRHPRDPRSPTSSYQRRAVKIDCRTQIPQLQLPKTPEQERIASNEILNQMQSEMKFSTYSRTNGKGSQIRKSLRTIGKLINGSEKRSQQNSTEQRSTTKVANNFSDAKSPNTVNARTLRRQSLTGVQASGPGRSRRSSLGGNSIDSRVNDSGNAKTPPPFHPSAAKIERRWL